MHHEIEFEGASGVALRGWLELPDVGPAPYPGVVMAHGFSAVKEMALDRYAEVLRTAGMAVLVYDHRNLGASDGEPRQEIDPWAQARDYRRALGWLAARPEVDAERVALWGSSYSGGEVIAVAACDRRVKAVVANVPFAGLPGVDYTDTTTRFSAIRDRLLDESADARTEQQENIFGPLPVVRAPGINGPVVLDQEESSEWFLRAAKSAPSWRNEITLRNGVGTDPLWDPGVCVEYVAPTPLLLIVADQDRLADTDVTRAAFERAGEPRRLVLIDGHHFTPYDGDGFARSSSAARDFLREHLQR